MRRIQGTFGTRDPEEEKRKTREAVLSNLLVFGAIVGMIRTGKFYEIKKNNRITETLFLAPYVIQHFS